MPNRQTSPCKITPRNSIDNEISPVSGVKSSLMKKNKIVQNRTDSKEKENNYLIKKTTNNKTEHYKKRLMEKEFLLGTRNKLSVKKLHYITEDLIKDFTNNNSSFNVSSMNRKQVFVNLFKI
jgi:hypothetical protein